VAEEVLTEHADRIASVVIVPSGGGRFVVAAGERTIFDKKAVGRFPDEGEVARLLAGPA
jgi:predicted Rdx family selenoprotein